MDKLSKAADREIRTAWNAFDRSTAYYCAIRKVPYDETLNRKYWAIYQETRKKHGFTDSTTSPWSKDLYTRTRFLGDISHKEAR